MQCPQCGAESPGDETACPACGAALEPAIEAAVPNRRARGVRIGFGVLMALVFVLVAAVAILRPAAPSPTPAPSSVPTASVEPTAPPVDPDRAAIEAAIRGFYATVDAGESVTVSPYVDPKGRGGARTRAVDASGTTTFSIARAVVGTGSADVFGRESRSVVATGGAEVEFRLGVVDGEWLISSWQVARAETMPSQALALSGGTAKDVVGTLLQAHQVGDTTTLTLLTTERFRAAHSSWLDGVDRSSLLISWQIGSAKRKGGAAYAVTVKELWRPTPLTSTYTVVMSGGQIVVDAWSWK
jgi:hypothetical protein